MNARVCFTAVLVLSILALEPALATPSSTVWTNCCIDIQPAGVTRLDVDNYFSFGSNRPNDQFGTDFGPLWGIQITRKLAMEFGFDILGSPSTTPFFGNAKIGFREHTISPNAPALQLGFFGFGTSRGATNSRQNVVHLIAGGTLPNGKTRLHASYYVGSSSALRSSTGGKQNTGWMAAFDHQLVPDKWVLAGDYASGKNAIGGGAIGIYYYFTKDIAVLTGPVWFNDKAINGGTKMTLQFDINF